VPFPAGRKELSGAVVLAAGLILGGAISVASRHLNLHTPGLHSAVSEWDLVAGAAPAVIEDELARGSSDSRADADVACPVSPAVTGRKPAGAEPAAGRGPRLGPVDINRADAKQLEALDGVGPALAARIVELRGRKGGRFRSMEELLEVRGIGPATLEKIKASAALDPIDEALQKIAFRKSTSSQADSSSFQR
jgi:competence ComEA-like helix-hairpin-helix protein